MALSLFPVSALGSQETSVYQSSGGLPKLTRGEITQLLEDSSLSLPASLFETDPSLTAPYAPGKVTHEALQAALDRLNLMRRLAGLPGVTLDTSLNENAQYGALLLAVSSFSHSPAQPGDMDSSTYQNGLSAVSSSNIHYGSGGIYSNLVYSVDSYMDDSDAGNISRIGHRRWQLNPSLGKVGFGLVKKGSAAYMTEKVFDRSGATVDYDFIAWPASGNFPNEIFDGDTPWSITLNPDKYLQPSPDQVSVTLTRTSDQTTWTFSGSNYSPSDSGAYFTIDTANYGVNNCIIFRPDEIASYDGLYTVTIQGLKNKSGQSVSLAYQVDFFRPGQADLEEKTLSAAAAPVEERFPAVQEFPGYSDVPGNAYYAPSAKTLYEMKIMIGDGTGRFNPNQELTIAECSALAAVMYSRAHGGDGYLDRTSPWYTGPMTYLTNAAMEQNNWSAVTLLSNQDPEHTPITRAGFILLLSLSADEEMLKPVNNITALPDTTDSHVLAFYNAGILSGTDKYGTFAGDQTLTRKDCAVMTALLVRPGLRPASTTLADYSPFAAARVTPTTLFFPGVPAERYLTQVNSLIAELEQKCDAEEVEFNWGHTYGGQTFLDYVKSQSLSQLGVTAGEGTQVYQDFDLQVYYSRLVGINGGF